MAERSIRIAAALLLALASMGRLASALALLTPEEGSEARIEACTVIIRPHHDRTTAEVTVFVAFTLPGEAPLPRATLLIPFETLPTRATAQAMSWATFDRAHVHADDLEGAFYAEARGEQHADTVRLSAIGAAGGLPAWCLIAPQWPPRAPGHTAVAVPDGAIEPGSLPEIETVRILPGSAYHERPARVHPASAIDGGLVEVSLIPAASTAPSDHPTAVGGVRVVCEAPIPSEGIGEWRWPCGVRDLRLGGTIVRVYVVDPLLMHGSILVDDATQHRASPQGIMNDALRALSRAGTQPRRQASLADDAHGASVLTGNGNRTLRYIFIGTCDRGGRATFAFSRAGRLNALRVAAGGVLLALLWPIAVVLHLASLWAAVRAYRWMTGFPSPDRPWRRYALLAVFSPLVTLWFMLKWLRPPGPLPDDGDRSGALGVLSIETYECVVRLVLWALHVGVNWLGVAAAAELGQWLRYDWHVLIG